MLYDQYSMGSAFDLPTQNTINESIIGMHTQWLIIGPTLLIFT